MTITIQIKSNEKELKKKMGLFQRKHLPKATANAINEIGAKVMRNYLEHLEQMDLN